MASLHDWAGAAPEGEQLVAAAPLTLEWRRPVWSVFALLPFLGVASFLAPGPWLVRLLIRGLLVLLVVAWNRGVLHRRPRPTGMAAVLNVRRGPGPVLVVTDTAVRLAPVRPSLATGVAQLAGPAPAIPGLVSLKATGEKLVASFADGSTAMMGLRRPAKGAAARVAALATPVLEQQHGSRTSTGAADLRRAGEGRSRPASGG